MEAYSVRVNGRVQGVGFRYWACRTAVRLGIAGWVKNNFDGSVSIHAESSDRKHLTMFLKELRRGPSSAVVRQFDITETAPRNYVDFDVEY